jgi:rRNA maturation RNase YbeY
MMPEKPEFLELGLDERVDPQFAGQVDLERLQRVIEHALVAEGLKGPVELSLTITDDATIQSINATHRGIDRPTDVLSFPLLNEGDQAGFVLPPGMPVHLGDIVISFPRAKEQAQEYGHSLERELSYLTVHGVLHLLGYDHEDEEERQIMRNKEEAALAG